MRFILNLLTNINLVINDSTIKEVILLKNYLSLFFILLSINLYSNEIFIDFYDIFESHGIPRLIIDSSTGSIVKANKGACLFYGYTIDELINMDITQINISSVEEIYKEMALAKIEERNYFHFIHRLKSGELRHVEVYSYPFTSNEVTYLYSLIIDVTSEVDAINSIRRKKNIIITLSISISILLIFLSFLLFYFKEKYRSIANYDQLTEIYSRRILNSKKVKDLFEHGDLSLVMVDINQFKKINDSYGHAIGDKVLKSVASTIKNSLRTEDIVIRYGGDEFLLMLKGVDKEKVEEIMNRIACKLVTLKEFSFIIQISFGIKVVDSNITLNEAIKIADKNMYDMKKTICDCKV